MLSPVIITPNQIELSNFRLNKAGYFITLSLMILSVVLPILISILILSTGGKPTFGLFISWAVFGFITYFFYRLATWNKHGKEYFILENDVFIYKPEAKNISYKIVEFKLEQLVVSIVNSDEQVEYDGVTQNVAWLQFNDGEKDTQTNIKTPQSFVFDIIKVLETWGIKNEQFIEELKD